MMEPVKGPRRYDSTSRQERTLAQRRAVLDAALDLMSENGYVATPMSGIAGRAGASVEFVYKQFGDKAGLAARVLDFALVGDESSQPMEHRPHVERMIAEPDARVVLALYARTVGEVNDRAGAFLVAVAAAAPTDARLKGLWRTAQAKRLAGVRAMVRNVATKAELSASERHVTDLAWALIGPELHALLTRERRWGRDKYTDWVSDALTHSILATPLFPTKSTTPPPATRGPTGRENPAQ
ncbi:TetR/AcrR family transcriptional regulator [Marisediminicola senii]|uniref:TetR/AcrR family transcriptional regulator n=1 Tax=Marisediminicola senii TaxID=2711233 RepID=UPI0013EA3571|nr:helix-turn-helix domain-containing protein [Marisediminicola senii]